MQDKTYTLTEIRDLAVQFKESGLFSLDDACGAFCFVGFLKAREDNDASLSPTPQEECKHESDGWLINGNGAYRSCKKCYEIIEERSHEKPSPSSLPEPLEPLEIREPSSRTDVYEYVDYKIAKKVNELVTAVNHLQELSSEKQR